MISDVTIVELETEIAILTHNQTELKSKSRTVTKLFFQSVLVSSFIAHRCSGCDGWHFSLATEAACVCAPNWMGERMKRVINLRCQFSSDIAGDGLVTASVLSAAADWTGNFTFNLVRLLHASSDYLYIKTGMSDCPTALHKGVVCASMPAEARSAESKQGQVDMKRSDVSACSN